MTNYIIVFQMPTMAEAALESLLLLIYHSSSTFNKNPCILKNLENSIQTIAAATTTIAAFTATISNVNMKRVGIFS